MSAPLNLGQDNLDGLRRVSVGLGTPALDCDLEGRFASLGRWPGHTGARMLFG